MSGRRWGMGSGGATRIAIFLQVSLTLLLALVAVAATNWLAGRQGIRQRYDWTDGKKNELSTAAMGVLGNLDKDIVLDVFWRPLDPPLRELSASAMSDLYDLLRLFETNSGGRIRIRNNYDTSNEEITARLAELKLYGFESCVVVSNADVREVLRFKNQLVLFDPGNTRQNSYRPAFIRSFNAETEIVKGILRVTREGEQRVYFTRGQGEVRLEDTSPAGLSLLGETLAGENISVHPLDFLDGAGIPEDCRALVILSPRAAFSAANLEVIKEYVKAGGRLLLAPHREDAAMEDSDVQELAEYLGVVIHRGLINQIATDALGKRSLEKIDNEFLSLGERNMHPDSPITRPLRAEKRVIDMSGMHHLQSLRQPNALEYLGASLGATFQLFSSQPKISWIDKNGNHKPDSQGSAPEDIGRIYCPGIVSSFTPAGETSSALTEKTETRVLIMGGSDPFTNVRARHNGDFARNAFNWLVGRDYRVSISVRDTRRPRLDKEGIAAVSSMALKYIPGLCVLMFGLTAYLRSRQSARRV